MTRLDLSQRFLEACGWEAAERRFLAGDASDRSYDRLRLGSETAVLMDAPPGRGDDPAAFIAIAQHLGALGLSAPRVLAKDLENGFLLLEDLGDGIYARLLASDPSAETELYAEAAHTLLHLQNAPLPPGLPDLTAQDWAEAAAFALDWYRFGITGTRCDTADFIATLAEALARHADGPRVLILRDFHAENLLWLPERTGLARVGLLDFQLAQAGQPEYDLVSLLQDARRDVRPEVEAETCATFRLVSGKSETAFAAAYATLGTQRALRILGIFARLCLHGGKPGYLHLIPRVWLQLQQNLSHPALARLAPLCNELLPAPSPERLARIADQCPTP